ncbi:c-type cytochrome [Aestuariicella hydrocarbonica]|uniref:C-type cytochrome n=1 Tax=Pseudomaricurvus hydrocarbonicus TaxID=1470433 RepID=A0A9E5MLC3_9GAMM|nr:PQQ-dependent sugar dehydrogenase [Aestuariicella hydrocarbonica]NHO64238.1 c-type cytochrome [Aestuariicella hydrocarbonica]
MLVWIIRAIKVFLIIWALLVLALVAFISFGPVSSPAAVFNAIFGLGSKSPDAQTVETTLSVPQGFSLGQYATDLKAIRFMEFSSTGDLIVSQPRKGKVLLLKRDADQDGQNDGVSVLLDHLNRPHGLAFHQDWLYIAESDAIGRIPFNHQSGTLSGTYERIITGLTDNGNHWTKSIRIKDGSLYVSMGSTCNVCEEKDPRRATIMRFDLDGNNGEIYASGLRNSVGLDFAPWDGQLYATDNGRDLLGDDYPVCELNKIEHGGFYGWPYINGFGDPDPDFGEQQKALQATAIDPAFGFRPHNAPLGIRFLSKMQRPADYERSALVALHGSWNRTQPDGYKVVSLHWDQDGNISSDDFLSGFETDGNIIGRPVDIAEGPDGCAYVSDDYAGTIYRVCYGIEQDTLNTQNDRQADDPQWHALSPQARQQSAKQGEALYALHACSSCHQLNGEGNPEGKKLHALHSRYTLSSLSVYFLTPNPPMPQYDLTARQRHELAVYLLSQTP